MRYRRNTSGFTLIELLTVIVIVSILAVIMMWTLFSAKNRAYCASVVVDLKSLAVAQEAYVSENDTYLTINSGPGNQTNLVGIYLSPGVVIDASSADSTTWSVTASHPACDQGPVTWTEQGRQ